MKLGFAPFPATGSALPEASRRAAGDGAPAAEDFGTLLARMLRHDAEESWNPGGWMGAPVEAFQRAGLTEGAQQEAPASPQLAPTSPAKEIGTLPEAAAARAEAAHAVDAKPSPQSIEVGRGATSHLAAGDTPSPRHTAATAQTRAEGPTLASAMPRNPAVLRDSGRAETPVRRAAMPALPEGGAARMARFAAQLLEGGEQPVLLLRMFRLSGQERAELEAQVGRLFESLGLRKPRLTIRETAERQADHG